MTYNESKGHTKMQWAVTILCKYGIHSKVKLKTM